MNPLLRFDWIRSVLVGLAICSLLGTLDAQTPAAAPAKAPVPFRIDRSQPAIDGFLAADKLHPPPHGAILFIGSSIFRKWTTLTEQMAPLPVLNRAFGGSQTPEVLYYTDAIVLPYAPRVIVYYCGSNDINADRLPGQIAANFRAFSERVHAKLPHTLILFTSIIRAPQKRDHWDRVDEANRLIRAYIATDPRLTYIDVNPAVFDAHGQPRMDLYLDDLLHYKMPAYEGFTAIIKPVVNRAWAQVQAEPVP